MKLEIYSIRDNAAQTFGHPMFAPTNNVAERNFGASVNREDSMNAAFLAPQDFDLFHLGTFDDQTGKLTYLESGPHHITNGQKLAKQVSISSVNH